MFPFPSIFQHYVEFYTCTIATLEKLLGARSFGGIIGHLACCQAICFVFSGRLDLPYVVRTIVPSFLGCWALIVPAFVIRF
jgi:hypothetical protein